MAPATSSLGCIVATRRCYPQRCKRAAAILPLGRGKGSGRLTFPCSTPATSRFGGRVWPCPCSTSIPHDCVVHCGTWPWLSGLRPAPGRASWLPLPVRARAEPSRPLPGRLSLPWRPLLTPPGSSRTVKARFWLHRQSPRTNGGGRSGLRRRQTGSDPSPPPFVDAGRLRKGSDPV
jgi:hypothetical protein